MKRWYYWIRCRMRIPVWIEHTALFVFGTQNNYECAYCGEDMYFHR